MLLITVSVLHDWSRTCVTDVKCYIKQVILQGAESGDLKDCIIQGRLYC